AGERHRRPLAIVFGLVVAFLVVEVVGGILTGSLALLSDAGHMATDAVGLGMALAAIAVARRAGGAAHRTFGLYRLEILAALANAVLLLGVGVYVVVEAIRRFADPPEIDAGPMLVVAVGGLLVNVIGLWLLHRGAEESLNVEGAYLEVLADLLGSIGVVAAGFVVAVTGWRWVDPLFAAGIAVFIFPRAIRLGRRALRILLQVAPDHIDVTAVETSLESIPGVVAVHDLHVWTLTSAMEVASAHLVVADDVDPHDVLDEAERVLEDRYGIEHGTLQIEPADHGECHEVRW
ncbi:MAG TPA: cation transporter, partial [Actinobacteria bacterium]|nr:cation transporter [Actinomycetota bacterium]